MITKEELTVLENKLNEILPADDGDTFGTDGSDEALLDVFENAWSKTDTIARKAINMLKDMPNVS